MVSLVILGALVETAGVALLPGLFLLLTSPDRVLSRVAAWTHLPSISTYRSDLITLYFSVGLGIFFLFKNILLTWILRREGIYMARLQVKIGSLLMNRYLHRPYVWYLHRNTADLQRNLGFEVGNVFERVFFHCFGIVSEVCVTLFIASLLFTVDFLSSLLAVAIISVTAWAYIAIIRQAMFRLSEKQGRARGQLIKAINQAFGGIKELTILGREKYFEDEFEADLNKMLHAGETARVLSSATKYLIEAVAMIGLSLLVAVIYWKEGSLHSAALTLALFGVAAVRLMPAINRLAMSIGSLHYGRSSLNLVARDVLELKNLEPEKIAADSSLVSSFRVSREIELKHVSYRYPNAATDAITDVNLVIAMGTSVGFVGVSGAGKTTLVDVILGLLEPTEGMVLADGKNIHEFLSGWQRQLGYIPQSIYLGDETVRKNVALGIPDDQIDDEKVWMALEKAKLADVVKALPGRLDCYVGERGIRLSGGQRQRIGIARALYPEPGILILDEATAALDNQTEREIVEVLESLAGTKTMITIAHRLTTIERCDKVFLLKEGRLVADGTYQSLIKESREFARIAQSVQSA